MKTIVGYPPVHYSAILRYLRGVTEESRFLLWLPTMMETSRILNFLFKKIECTIEIYLNICFYKHHCSKLLDEEFFHIKSNV